jgi:hypothetical protein
VTTSLRRPRRRTLSRLTAAPVALLLALSLAACGGDDEGDDPEGEATSAATSEPAATDSADAPSSASTEESSEAPTDEPSEPSLGLTEEDLVPALIVSDDLPSGFEEITPESDDSADNPFKGTCFADVQQFDEALGSEPTVEAETEFEQSTGDTQTTLNSKVALYDDPDAVAAKLPEYLQTIDACDSVKTTTPDGFSFELQVTTDDNLTVPGASQQARIDLSGTISGQGQTFPVSLTLVAAIVDGALSTTGTSVLGQPDSPIDLDSLATLQGSRVQEVLG